MKRSSVRASALFNVLVLLTLVFLAAFFMMSALSSHHQLNSRYQQRTQLDFVARAATNEILLRLRSQPRPDPSKRPPSHLKSLGAGPEIPLFSPTPHLPYSSWLLSDRSVDNSLNPDSAQSRFDAAGHKSVPPFCLSLAIKIVGSDGTHVYESLVQQRWPYALVAPGPIFLCGGIDRGGTIPLPPTAYCSASLIDGRLLALSGNAYSTTAQLQLALSAPLLSQLLPFAVPYRRREGGEINFIPGKGALWGPENGRAKRVKVGGEVVFPAETPPNLAAAVELLEEEVEVEPEPVQTRGALLDGGVDLLENSPQPVTNPEVSVDRESRLNGSVRKDYRLAAEDPKSQAARQRFSDIFTKPDTSEWPEYSYNGRAAGLLLDEETVPSGRCQLVLNYFRNPEERRAYQLEDQSVTLNNVEVAVQGNFVLTGCKLSGSGASLVVDGTLVLDGGQLEAGDNGLVIYCRSLVMRANGHFKGLIVAQQGANFHGGGGDEKLVIEGGLLVGANGLNFSVDGKGIQIPGLALCSTEIRYAPQYLRGLNRYADFSCIGLALRP